MFDSVVATIPLTAPEMKEKILHATLFTDLNTGEVRLTYFSEPSAYDLVMKIRMNNLLSVDVAYVDLAKDASSSSVEATSLLSKYMDHVATCEGVDFLSDSYRSSSAEHDVIFTDEEWATLKNL